MAKDEMMELGRLIVQSDMEALYIKDIRILERVNEHGRMDLRFLSRKKLTAEDAIRYQNTPIQIFSMGDEEPVFCGICKSIGIQNGNDYAEIQVTAYTSSILTDQEQKSRTFQTEQKTLGSIMGEGIGSGALVSVDSDITITEMLSQEQETDWVFDRRIANQYQKQLFVNSKSLGCQIHVGFLPFQIKELGVVEDTSFFRDVDAVRDIQGNTMPKASVFEFEKTVLKIYDLSIGVGYAVTYQGRQQIVTKSEIQAGQGVVWNTITLSNKEGVAPNVAASMGSMGRNSILTGEVLAVEGTMVQVDFHSPGDAPRWIPYASASSNYFYSMPDVHDTVFVYYETGDSDRIVCLGSKHINDSPDFGDYKNKMLTANNRMLRFSPEEVSIVGNRKEYDGKGGDQAKIIFNDEAGVDIYSTQDIVIETTDGGNVTIQSAKDSYAGLDAIKESFTQRYTEGHQKYEADGGNTDFDAVAYLAGVQIAHIRENIESNLLSPLQVIGTIRELGDRIGGGDGEKETVEELAPVFTDGVVDIFGLERVVIQVGASCIIFGGGIIQIKSNNYMQLGTDRSATYEHLEQANYTWKDMFLDVTQCALDIIGVLPIPGVATAANLINAGISFARGDYLGAAMSAGQAALSLLPGANTAAAPVVAAKTLTKGQKALKTVKAIVEVVQMLASGAETLNMALMTGMAAWDILDYAAHGKFDMDDPECRQDVGQILQGITEGTKGGIERKKTKGGDGPQPRKTRSEREADRSAPKDTRSQKTQNVKANDNNAKESNRTKLDQDSKTRCKGCDPIDMVTGSYLIEQCDFIINDINGIFAVERTYESLLCTEDSPVGKGWTLNLFSRAILFDDRVEVILPDNHTETFLKTADGYRNRRGGTKRLSLTETEDGFAMQEARTGITRIYDKKGRLTQVLDRNGNQTLYQYKGERPEKIEFASGQYLSLGWQGNKLVSMKDCIGRCVRYDYDGDLLTSVEMVNGGVETYRYDAEGRVIEITDAVGNTYVHNEYDAGNRVTRQRLLGGQEYILLYADHERTNTYLAPANGKQIRYIYNKKKQLIRTEYPDQTTEEYAYDDWENRIMEKDRLGNETRRTYDESGNLLEESFPHGLVCSYEYDPEGNCISSRDNTGRLSRYVYDKCGNLTKEIQQITDSLQREVSYEYDQYGRVTAFTDGNGNRETYRYTGKFWEAESFTTAGGSRYRHTLDGAGRCVELENADGVSSFAYNNYDILCMETDPLGLTTRYIYSRTTDLMWVIRPNHYAPDGVQEPAEHFTYDAFHNRLSRTDETGAVFAMHRDGEGNITKEINPNFYHPGEKDGTGIEYRYDADDRLCLSIYPDGGKERRWYDAAGNLTGLCRPEQYREGEDAGQGFSYAYDAANRLVQITGPDGKIRKRYVYDLHGNICKVIGAKGMETGETDEERIGELYTYNYAGWLMESRIPVRVEDGKALYRLTRYRYDKAGNRTEEKRYNDYQTKESAAGTVLTIRYEYDKDDRLVKVTDSTGAVLEYGYDSQNRRVSESRKISDTACQTFRYRYDAAGRMMELHRTADREGSGRRSVTVRYEYDRNGNMTRTILPSGAEILREYDPADRLVTETHADPASGISNTTRFAYDKAGNLTCITDNQGRNTLIEYDAMNREIRRTEKDGSITRNFYDRNGQLVKTIRPNAYAEHKDEGAGYAYTYDAEGRIVTVIRPDGTIQESSVYDGEGNLIQTTDAAGSRVRYTYDFGGRQTEVRTGGQASQKYVYDAAGNITGIEDGAGNHTGYALDAWGRIVEIRKADGSSEYYRYDCAGNIVQSTDGEGNATTYEYNGINQLASVTDPMGGQETYAYDAEERLCKKTDRNGTEIRYTYNIYGNLLTKTAGELSERYEYTPEGLLKSAISGGMRYSYTYDAMGRMTEKTASGRKLLTFVYDKNGNLTAQEDVTGKVTEYRYNLLDQVTEVWDSGKRLAAYTYNPDGTVRSIKNGNSLHTEYSYDADKNLIGLLTKLGDDTIVENHYRYDGNGNRTEKQQKHGTTAYTYDRLNQLVEVNYPDRTETLFYDKAGNRTGRVAGGAEERYYYDKRNRLTAQEKNGVHTEYQYDAAGNLVKDGKAAYTYDAFNRNTRVETFDGNIQINRYDAEGLRHEMEENGKLVQFIFRGTEVVAEETQEEKIRYIRTHELLASDAESARTYYHYASDEMGSITHVTAGNEILNRYEYDAWGNAEVCEEQVANRFRFNGQQYDPVSQQYYLRARFYNPVIARFTQEDTYRGDGLNLYAYCRNNPVYYVDPSGHICDPVAQKIMEKLGNHQATRNEQKKLAAYLRNKDRHGGLTDAERGALQQVDSYTYLPRYENQTLPWKNNKGESKSGTSSGYYQDANGRWHRPNGDFASNAEVGIASPAKTATGSHGNSLSDPRTNYGYVLVDKDTNEILKFGETLYPETRYSKSYLEQNNAVMKVLESGSKEYIHYWQYDMNKYFEYMYDEFPPLLKSKGW